MEHGNQQPSISDHPVLVASSTPTTADFSPAAVPSQTNTSPTCTGGGGVLQQNPMTSLLLDNITYDAILASSAKSLRLAPGSAGASPLPSSDARAPPNTPSSAEMSRYASFSGMAGTK